MVAGALLVLGPLRPWAYISFGGLRVPLYGLLGPGGLILVGGVLLLLHPRLPPALLAVIALGTAYAALVLPAEMLASARTATDMVQSWLDPLNQLLDRFHIAAIRLTDWSLPAARTVGPGVRTTLWGAGFAAAAAVCTALVGRRARPTRPGVCPSCAAPLPQHRELRFCTTCGGSVVSEPICSRCQALAEPDDRFCGRCGEPIAR
jgi:hypothetical protein